MDQSIEDIWQSRDLIEQTQVRRLTEMLETIIPRNRFYTSKFEAAGVNVADIRSLEDLRQLPVTTKQELVDSQAQQPPYGANLSYPSTAYTRLHQTSGTTGRPMRWMDTADSWNWIMECWRQIYLLAGLTEHDRLFFPFSFGPFIGFWAAFEGASRLGNFVIAGGGMSTSIRLHAMIENEATVVCCTPTYALRMAEVAAEEGINLQESSVRMLIVAGEPGGAIPATRARMESAWEAHVIDHWGMTEIASLGVESADRTGGMYLLETEMIAEIVDPETLEPVAAGEVGELLITNLGRLGSPLIRYRTRDLVKASTDEDPSGRKLLWLSGEFSADPTTWSPFAATTSFHQASKQCCEKSTQLRNSASMSKLFAQCRNFASLSNPVQNSRPTGWTQSSRRTAKTIGLCLRSHSRSTPANCHDSNSKAVDFTASRMSRKSN